jgi:hypothetical protein
MELFADGTLQPPDTDPDDFSRLANDFTKSGISADQGTLTNRTGTFFTALNKKHAFFH